MPAQNQEQGRDRQRIQNVFDMLKRCHWFAVNQFVPQVPQLSGKSDTQDNEQGAKLARFPSEQQATSNEDGDRDVNVKRVLGEVKVFNQEELHLIERG